MYFNVVLDEPNHKVMFSTVVEEPNRKNKFNVVTDDSNQSIPTITDSHKTFRVSWTL